MKAWIGKTSASIAQSCAWVWKRKEPMPIAARMTTRRRAPRSRAVMRQQSAAAIRNAALLTALSGSDQ